MGACGGIDLYSRAVCHGGMVCEGDCKCARRDAGTGSQVHGHAGLAGQAAPGHSRLQRQRHHAPRPALLQHAHAPHHGRAPWTSPHRCPSSHHNPLYFGLYPAHSRVPCTCPDVELPVIAMEGELLMGDVRGQARWRTGTLRTSTMWSGGNASCRASSSSFCGSSAPRTRRSSCPV